jgi:ubiquinone/menaquinone biosynthesis C-methylase UbiE
VSIARHRPSAQDTQKQYARRAQRYAESRLHLRGETLETVRRLARAATADIVLDVGTGTGFTAFALAPDAGRVIGADLTPEMLGQGQHLARERGLEAKLEWIVAAAERLPFPNNTFSLTTCRYACHHFHDLPRALGEMARVTQPDGQVVLCDVVAPEAPGIVELMNEMEQIRDRTHVWEYPLSEWRERLLPAAGLKVDEVVPGKSPQVFSEWVQRAGTPREAAQQLIEMFMTASVEVRRAFQVRREGAEIFFSWDNATVLATKR